MPVFLAGRRCLVQEKYRKCHNSPLQVHTLLVEVRLGVVRRGKGFKEKEKKNYAGSERSLPTLIKEKEPLGTGFKHTDGDQTYRQ